MARIYDCSVDTELLTGMRLARSAVGRGELVVIPTDTVYGVAADAFTPAAVRKLLAAKGRGPGSPPPVLIPGLPTLDALAENVHGAVRDLVEAFWPGGLTIVVRAQHSLAWDLGETHGTVALRMPSNRIALELLAETGPLAVSSANLTGRPAPSSAAQAEAMLGESVAVYLDGGDAGTDYTLDGLVETSSTIVDATPLDTGGAVRILRHGVVPAARLREVIGDALEADAAASVTRDAAAPDAAADAADDRAAPGS
ncbi:L-threonylcarbamoyladenylate synthase [Compostimonas suwonensis]|nr:L-threonylcarbamoyladenylate synthase [Compostimonas suwonensis]